MKSVSLKFIIIFILSRLDLLLAQEINHFQSFEHWLSSLRTCGSEDSNPFKSCLETELSHFFFPGNNLRFFEKSEKWASRKMIIDRQEINVIYSISGDREYALSQDLIIEPCIPDLLDVGHYNYVVLLGGNMLCGKVLEPLELGVKHVHLAMGKGVLAAGEFYIHQDQEKNKVYQFNMMSGSYFEYVQNFRLKRDVLFSLQNCLGPHFQLSSSSLHSTLGDVKAEDIKKFCVLPHFRENNAILCQWIDKRN